MLKRADALAALANQSFDVLVIGGGATGAGVAFDAVTRGYSVALIEQRDYAAGTSSRSSKLIHGGLRYLQNFDLGLVREALLERQINATLAPNIVKPLPIIVPSFGRARPDRLLGLGLNMYDVMAVNRLPLSTLWRRRRKELEGENGKAESSSTSELAPEELTAVAEATRGSKRATRRSKSKQLSETGPNGEDLVESEKESPRTADWSPERHRLISGAEVVKLIPALKKRDPNGGYLFYDCQTDDVRLVLTILQAAAKRGAVSANGVQATGLVQIEGLTCGAKVRDSHSGEEFEIAAANVINATGVWADQLRPEELHDEAEVPEIRPSRGTHILIPRQKLPLKAGAIAPASGKRTIFILPWLGSTLIGTTDNDYKGEELEHISPPRSDINYLLKATNEFFDSALTPQDITGAFAGVRPLISGGDSKKSVDISRKAELYETSSGMITITGGKITTWRRMAKMTVDRIVERSGRDLPCQTQKIQLGAVIDPATLERVQGIPEKSYQHLADRYGEAVTELLTIARERPEFAKLIVEGHPDIVAEIIYAIRYEQALTIGDVLLRRTRLGLLAARELMGDSKNVVKEIAKVMATELGWKRGRRTSAVEEYVAEAAAEGVVPN
jgi:glycerol-3-phosphate dehydrogenase